MKRIIIAIAFASLALSGCAMKSQNDMTFDELAYGEEGPVALTSVQHVKVADGYVRQAKPEMALMHYNKALELDENNTNARLKRGDLLVSQGLDEQAMGEYLTVLKTDPDNAIANQSAGIVYFRSGLYSEARTHLEKALALNPMLWRAHNYLGILDDRDGNFDDAYTHFTAALELHKGTGLDEIHNNIGVVHIARKEYEKALVSFHQALNAGGLSARTYNNMGLALTRLGRINEALEAFKYAGGEARAYNNVGYVLLQDNRPGEAVPYFEKAIELSPSYYVKAADNLKRAKLAQRFKDAGSKNTIRGSTPNPLLSDSFPEAEQIPGEPAASPASAGSPPPSDITNISYEQKGSGVPDIREQTTYGLHVSSWRRHASAFADCERLSKQGFDTWINQVDTGEKGIWYRVLVGKFASMESAQLERPTLMSELGLQRSVIYKRIRPRVDGSHL